MPSPPHYDAVQRVLTQRGALPTPVLGHRYALSQTTLEQIFNLFASQQDEEKGAVRGMRTVA